MMTEEDLHRTNNSEGTHHLLIHILVLEVEDEEMIDLSGRHLSSRVADQRTEGYFYILIFLARIETNQHKLSVIAHSHTQRRTRIPVLKVDTVAI